MIIVNGPGLHPALDPRGSPAASTSHDGTILSRGDETPPWTGPDGMVEPGYRATPDIM